MRGLLILVLLVLLSMLAGLTLGETWLAGRVAAAAGRDQRVHLEAAQPLDGLGRFGLHLTGVDLADGAGRQLRLPQLDLWVRPTAPATLRAALPAQAQVQAGTPRETLDLDVTAGQAALQLSPLNGLALARADLQADALGLAGAPFARDLALTARLDGLGADAPPAARAAYDLTLDAAAIDPAALGRGLPALPGDLSLSGGLRLWLDAAPGQGMMRGAAPAVPHPVGMRLDGLRIGVGDLGARLFGRLTPDASGRAEGRIGIVTADAGGFLDLAAGMGLIEPRAGMLGRGVIAAIAAQPLPEPAPDWPTPGDGEILLPLVLKDGQVTLAEFVLGPAPQFPH